jgi:hypothetical protein
MLGVVMLDLFDKLKLNLVLLDEALPSGKPWEGRDALPGYANQAAFAAAARPLALAVTQVLRNFLEGPLTKALSEARKLQTHDKLLGRLLESYLRKLYQTFEAKILEGDEQGVGGVALEEWLDALAREAALDD